MGDVEMIVAPAEAGSRSLGMEGIREVLEAARDRGLAVGRFRGLLHIAIGRRISKDGKPVSAGLTWRELAPILKDLRYDRELAREFGADPDTLAPRDRERFWYSAISMAHVDSPEATAEAESLIPELKKLGYVVGPNPAAISNKPASKHQQIQDKPTTKPKKK
jgi:hypothetical protein